MIIPSFKPSISYKELNTILARILFGNAPNNETSLFEQKFAQYLGVRHAIAVPSGRWGLYYILESLSLKESDEVILPAFTYFAVPTAIVKLGLRPVFVDINPENLNINIQKIRENITKKTRVIIPTHLCGFVCGGLDEIMEISRKHGIIIIEDCAQSLGAEYKGRKAGSWGDFSYFSFGVTKNFTTLGGGMIATNNDEIADIIRGSVKDISSVSKKTLFFELLKSYIMKLATSPILFPGVYCVMRISYFFNIDIIENIFHEKNSSLADLPKNGQLSGIQAELGMAQLNDLDRRNELRRENGTGLYERMKSIRGVRIPSLETDAKNIFSTCPVLVKDKKNKRKILLRKGVDVSSGYMRDCSRLEIFKGFKKHCPNASKAEEEALYLPLYPELTSCKQRCVEYVIKKICRCSLLIMLVLFSSISCSTNHKASKNIIYIPQNFPSIQKGIDSAKDGDVLLVSPGKYVETINFKGKMITVKSLAGPDATIIDGDKKGSVVVFNSGENRKSVLEGFTIQNGLLAYAQNKGGGGILCYKSGPLIKNNIIKNNNATNGGGILCQDCLDKKPLIVSNLIKDNKAVKGGGIRCSDSSPFIVNNIIIRNNVERLGGGIYWRQSSFPYIVNNTIMYNAAGEYGGGVFGSNYTKLEDYAILSNNILWKNRAPKGTQIALIRSGTKVIIASSTVQYGKDGIFLMADNILLKYFSDNISADPLIEDIDKAFLMSHSPCIDTGDNKYIASIDIEADFNGNNRISDGNSDGNAVVDIGACEFGALRYPEGTYNEKAF
jgi:dTDP-4-amino-4,6-dideoxygalactose transaminase